MVGPEADVPVGAHREEGDALDAEEVGGDPVRGVRSRRGGRGRRRGRRPPRTGASRYAPAGRRRVRGARRRRSAGPPRSTRVWPARRVSSCRRRGPGVGSPDRDRVGEALARGEDAVGVAGDDGRSGVVQSQLGLGDDFVVARRGLGEHRSHRLVAAIAFIGSVSVCARSKSSPASRDHRGDGAPLDLVAVEQGRIGDAVVDQGQLPGQVDGILQAGVHAVSLGGRAEVRRVAGQQHRSGAERLGHLRVAVEARRVLDVGERDGGVVAVEGRRRVGDEIRLRRARPQVDAPAPIGKRGEDDRDRVEVDEA